ncbi:MAG: sterol desaturase family protein [Betaproteobacteria bacterium]|nr:sterol desaturase family protein [Betaproteobacteria bacterium]
MFEWIANLFAELHGHVFQTAVLPLLHAAGYGGYAELAFDATEVFLIGAIEITLLAIVLGALERNFPLEQQDEEEKRVDVIYTLLQRLGFVPLLMFALLTPLIDGFDGWLRMHDVIPWKLEDALPALNASPWLSFAVYVVVLDFVAYWLHRWQHRVTFWWSLHALHHSQRSMSFWSDDRNHLLDDVLMDGAFALVALLIGVPPAQFVTIVVATRVVESLSHANLRLSFGRIGEYLLVSPRFHRVHHAIGFGHEGRARGCNFAVLFPAWDVLFGTANMDPVYPKTGIRDQLEGKEYGRGFWQQQWLGLVRLGSSLAGRN